MCAPDPRSSTGAKIKHSIKQTWYGFTLIYIAVMVTLIFAARIFDWRV